MIIKNKIQCKKCGDVVESKHTHDYVSCRCKAVAVDGGKDYLRRTGDEYIELSTIEIPVEEYWEMRNLLKTTEQVLNYIPNQKVLTCEGYKMEETYELASLISKFIRRQDEKT